jgi:hypothetical protein
LYTVYKNHSWYDHCSDTELFPPIDIAVLRNGDIRRLNYAVIFNVCVVFPQRTPEKEGDMRISILKLIPAKREFADMATDGHRPRVFSPSGGAFEGETRVISLEGVNR